jgi:hypothetical protein
MGYFDDASLVMIPSGYKDGKLYNVKPSDGAGDFTFTRGSNLAATRVNEDGLIEKGRENLLLQSNSFDTTWTNSNTTETSGQSGYDGSTDAWKIDKSVASGYITQSISQNSVQTFSVYAKAGTLDWVRLVAVAGTDQDQYFDLSTGTLGATGTNIDAVIDSAGGGWYRCSIALSQSVTSVRIYPADDDNDVSGATGNIYIQDAQLEVGLVATDYIETGATTAQAGILEDMPRLDYSGGALCPSLLLEPQRTNFIEHSEYFDDWSSLYGGTGFAAVLTANDAISPEGVQNAYKIVFNAGSGTTSADSSQLSKAVTFPNNTDGTSSIYLKGESGGEQIVFRGVADGTYTLLTLTTEWQRFNTTENSGTTSDAITFGIRQNVSGLGVINSSATIYAYGAQIEEASYPTSYIPTYGTSVTRGEDDCRKTGISSLIGQTEGTMFCEFDIPSNTEDGDIIAVNNGFSSDGFFVSYRGSNVVQLIVRTSSSNALIFQRTGVYPIGKNKIAVAYKNGDFAISLNGTATQVNTSTITMPSSISDLRLFGGQLYVQTLPIQYAQAALFKTRLSNAELATLTTL